MAAKPKASPYVFKNVLTYAGEPKPHLSEHEKIEIIRLSDAHKSPAAIADMIHCHKSTVGRVLQRYREEHTVQPKPHPGRPPKIPPEVGAEMAAQLEGGAISSTNDCVRWIASRHGINVSPQTVELCLRRLGKRKYTKRRKPFTDPDVVALRVDCAAEWLHFSDDEIAAIGFSDEKSFDLQGTPKKETVWLSHLAPFDERRIAPKLLRSNINVHVWACVTSHGILAHKVLDTPLNGEHYLSIIRDLLIPAVQEAFGEAFFCYQQDNHPAHVTDDVMSALEEEAPFDLLYWPAHSPDINLCENVWDELSRRVQAKRPGTKRQLVAAIEAAVAELNTDRGYFQRLYAGFRKRLQAVIRTHGLPVDH
eukprot:m.102069 g.102069  ORF g.102069 m.102069 type:complete len:364 (-) comp8811_c0_seq4:1460-2551(-)